MKNSRNLILSALMVSLFTSVSYGQVEENLPDAPSDQELIERQTEQGLLRQSNVWGLFDAFKAKCRYAIDVPDAVTRGTIALTFDDGPNPATTPMVLDVLKAHNIKATFFVLGSKIKGNEPLLRRIFEEGHHVGNHSYSHENFHRLGKSSALSEISATDRLIRQFGEPLFFRFPYGNSTCGAKEIAKSMNYRIVGWSIDTCDWAFADGKVSDAENSTCQAPASLRRDYPNFVLREVEKTKGGVLLMHDIHKNTAESLDRLVTSLEQRGYRFVSLDDHNIFPQLNNY